MTLELDALPENMELTIPQPKATEVYYRTCGVIGQHNRHRQDNLKTNKKLETTKWDMRVNLTIFSMSVVDTWLVYSQATVLIPNRDSPNGYSTVMPAELQSVTFVTLSRPHKTLTTHKLACTCFAAIFGHQ